MRMYRKNGQFASLKDDSKIASGNCDSSDGTSCPESVCQHCGISEKSTPAMRRGPAVQDLFVMLVVSCGLTREL
ncbi:ZIM-like 1 [Prunus dulcis]|uniref:ZIM-like 1 n=1 Tax=Prunus dulcis TaxID=3755 RepID=A0A5H2XKQ2_PRUDU|nr:ZIM-like 1 [Prunus dulcis]